MRYSDKYKNVTLSRSLTRFLEKKRLTKRESYDAVIRRLLGMKPGQ